MTTTGTILNNANQQKLDKFIYTGGTNQSFRCKNRVDNFKKVSRLIQNLVTHSFCKKVLYYYLDLLTLLTNVLVLKVLIVLKTLPFTD